MTSLIIAATILLSAGECTTVYDKIICAEPEQKQEEIIFCRCEYIKRNSDVNEWWMESVILTFDGKQTTFPVKSFGEMKKQCEDSTQTHKACRREK